ncbi:MAG: spore maturation protein [Fidelibacterota bacterium]|nr:MAG: spore maturation protein [Candidatus Neomarinimicrobiota bacterium]
MEAFITFLSGAANYIIPAIIVAILTYAIARRVKVYEDFVEGAKEGFTIAVRIIPYLVAILVAIGMFRASGAMDYLVAGLKPILGAIGFPPENLPMALMRPLSGSGSLGLLSDLVNEYGVDSLFTKIGATMFGSTETTFYVLAVYFGSVGIRRTRHAVAAGLLADLAGALSAVFFCKLLFG